MEVEKETIARLDRLDRTEGAVCQSMRLQEHRLEVHSSLH